MATSRFHTYVITTKIDSCRSKKILKETTKLGRWSDVHILTMATPCTNYKGNSDFNPCVQKNLFENHQKCAQKIIDSGDAFGMVLESDVIFEDDATLQKHMSGIVEWAHRNHGSFDVIFLGGEYLLDTDNALNTKHVMHVLEYCGKTHALIYSREFCRSMVDMRWPDGHFDMWLAKHRRDLRLFASAKSLATVSHSIHHLCMEAFKTLNKMLVMNSICRLTGIFYAIIVILAICIGVLIASCAKVTIMDHQCTRSSSPLGPSTAG